MFSLDKVLIRFLQLSPVALHPLHQVVSLIVKVLNLLLHFFQSIHVDAFLFCELWYVIEHGVNVSWKYALLRFVLLIVQWAEKLVVGVVLDKYEKGVFRLSQFLVHVLQRYLAQYLHKPVNHNSLVFASWIVLFLLLRVQYIFSTHKTPNKWWRVTLFKRLQVWND